MTYMTSNKTKWKSIPFQTEIRKARQLSFRILLLLLSSLLMVIWQEVSTAQCAHRHALGSACVGTDTGPLSLYFKEGYAAHRAQQVAQLSLGLQMIQPPLQITNLLAHCPRETYVPYPLPREPSSGLKWAWATMWTWTLLCRYKAMKVCLGPEDRPAMDAQWKNLTRLKTD